MKTSKALFALTAILVTLALLAGCGGGATTTTTTRAATSAATSGAITSATTSGAATTASSSAAGTTASGSGTTAGTDMVATASIVNTNEAFEKAISAQGTWIIATLKDLVFTKDLVVEGDFKNGRKDTAGADIYQRKIGLYTQDANRNVTNRFKLTVPKMTFKSLNGSIEHGTFIGDLYISGKNFKLIDATIQGNVYFQSADIKNTFTMDAASKITGVQEIKSF